MPAVDLSEVSDYATFERAYDQLIEVLDRELTDDHKMGHSTGRELTLYHHGQRLVGEEPKTNEDYRAIRFLDDGSVLVTRAERGVADAWSSRHDVDQAMATAVLPVIVVAATMWARQTGGEFALELVRLFRFLDDGWADYIGDHDAFRTADS